MAKHARQVVRENVVAQLVGQTAAAARVYPTREMPLRTVELPAICVYTLEETVVPESRQSSPRRLTRNLVLAIEAAVKQSASVDDALDALAVEIERAIDLDPYFNGAAFDSVLSSTQIGVDVDSERPTGRMLMSYAVIYESEAPTADDVPALDDFRTAHVETSIGGDQAPADRAVDTVTVPTT